MSLLRAATRLDRSDSTHATCCRTQPAEYARQLEIDKGIFEVNLSVPLVFEYEDVAKRNLADLPVDKQDVEDVLDYLCRISNAHELFFDWRPVLKDPGDEMVLQLAAAGCDVIVTFNKRDFEGAERFGVRVLTPVELLVEIGAIQ